VYSFDTPDAIDQVLAARSTEAQIRGTLTW
jgi:hypothetical protein